ncbi:hypothetical protein [Meiothermus sp.]|uniref:hypothetical protein n=1 Tax=Meiothermus sp. TaxID=1955249 RepID=UPI00307EFE4E
MRLSYLVVSLLTLLLAACSGESIMRPPGSPPSAPPQPPTNTFSISATPNPMNLARGSTGVLTVSVTFNASNLTRVRLTWVSGSVGVVSNTSTTDVTPNNNTFQFQITNNASPNEARPFFYIYGNGCTSNGCGGQEQRSVEIRTN